MPNTCAPVSLPLIVLGLACIHICKCSLGECDEFVGQCDEGNNCSECYQTLVKSLMLKDQNLFNLSKGFFPTNSDDRPQFVTITYRFKDSNDTRVWYWSEKGSFFVYPLQTFEYLSLFFGKASAFFAGNVTVTLDQECLYADDNYMEHLTQRIKLYIAKKSILPEIDDSYIATAYNDESWMNELEANEYRIVKIVFCTPLLAAAVFIIFVAVFLSTALCSCMKSIQNSKEDNNPTSMPFSISHRVKSAIVAIAVISGVHITYALGISGYACSAINDQPEFVSKSPPLYYISVMVAAANGILLILCIATDILALFMAIRCSNINYAYIVLCCTILYAALSILLHCPYIILAYINDALLTGSMFIFYTASWGLIFLAVSRFYTVYQELLVVRLQAKRNREQLTEESTERLTKSEIICNSFIFTACSLIFSVLVIGSVALMTCYLIILPITNGLSHLFGRLVDTYHTAIVIVGAFVAYKTFIEKK